MTDSGVLLLSKILWPINEFKKSFLLQLSEPVCMGGEVISVAVIAVALLGEQGQK